MSTEESKAKEKSTDVILEMTKQIILLCTSLLAAAIFFARIVKDFEYDPFFLESAVICLFITIIAAIFTFMAIISSLANGTIAVPNNGWVKFPGSVMIISFGGVIICLSCLLFNLI